MKTKRLNIFGKWLPVFLWATLIFIFSSQEQVVASNFFAWDFIFKKTAHILEYSILFILISHATGDNLRISFLLSMIYAISDEFHQLFVPGRVASILDLGFDLTGVNIAAYLVWKLNRSHQTKPNK